MTHWYCWHDQDLILQCHLQPKAKSDEIVGLYADAVKIRITAPPVDGKANNQLSRLLAQQFGVSISQVIIERGTLGRSKRVRIKAPEKIPAKLDISPNKNLF